MQLEGKERTAAAWKFVGIVSSSVEISWQCQLVTRQHVRLL
jgi:hypothetical protein